MARKFEEPNIRINQKLQVDKVGPSDAKSMKDVSTLYKAWTQARGLVYLDHVHSQYYFLGRLPSFEGAVGFCSLRSYNRDSMYGVSMLTHPDFERQGIATTLLKSAIDFAYENSDIIGLFALAIEHSRSEAISLRFGFKPFLEYKDKHISLHLDTTEREPVTDYNAVKEIKSDLVSIIKYFGIQDSQIHQLFSRVNWCYSVLTASITFGENHFKTKDDAEKILSQYFKNSFEYPYTDNSSKMSLNIIEAIIRCVEPDILGPQHRLALDKQKVFLNKLEKIIQVAVVRPFEDEQEFTINFYEREHR